MRYAIMSGSLVALLSALPSLALAEERTEASPVAVSERKDAKGDGPRAEEVGHHGPRSEKRVRAPLAGWNNGVFYLRDSEDNFQFFPSGRVYFDQMNYFGKGVSDITTLKSTFQFQTARIEISGNIAKKFSFFIGGSFGTTGLDNRPAAGKDPSAGAAETTKVSANITDAFLIYRALSGHHTLNLQMGQYDAPFTLESRTSDKVRPFMVASLPVRLANPLGKEQGIMAWGEALGRPDAKLLGYSLGIFNGNGQNRPSVDGQLDAMGRFYVRPLASQAQLGEFSKAQIGGSFRYGVRDSKTTLYDYPAMTTQGGFTFWAPTYTGSKGTTRILPSSTQQAFAGELRIPFWRFDLTTEFVYLKNNTREAVDGNLATTTERLGTMKGTAYHVMLDMWVRGNRELGGSPGIIDTAKLDFKKPTPKKTKWDVQALVKWEQVSLNYDSAAREGTKDSKNIDGDIKVNTLSLGANFFWTRNIRITANYVYNMFPDSAPPGTAGASNRAYAPGNTLSDKINADARNSAHDSHELMFRFGAML